MQKKDVKIGKVYLVTVSGKRARVRLTNESPYGGWDGVNEDTHRKVRVKTAGRLQREVKDPEARARQPEAAPETVPTEQEMPEVQEQRAASDEPTPENEQDLQAEADDQPQAAPEAAQAADTPPEQPTPDQEPEVTSQAPSAADGPQDAAPSATDAPKETRLSKLTIPELQAMYTEVVGRTSSSTNARYLQWKIRQAQKGRIPVGPRTRRTAAAAGDFKVLPLRMEAELVKQIDEARERLGLQSRMELFRLSLHTYLLEAGEVRVAELFAPTTEA